MPGFALAEQYIAIARRSYFQACLDLLLRSNAKISPDALRVRVEQLISKRAEIPAAAVESPPLDGDAELIEYLAAIDSAWQSRRPRVLRCRFECGAQESS